MLLSTKINQTQSLGLGGNIIFITQISYIYSNYSTCFTYYIRDIFTYTCIVVILFFRQYIFFYFMLYKSNFVYKKSHKPIRLQSQNLSWVQGYGEQDGLCYVSLGFQSRNTKKSQQQKFINISIKQMLLIYAYKKGNK